MVASVHTMPSSTRPGAAGYLLPYQRAWVLDKSPVAFFDKSRRIGADYAEAFRVVSERMSGERQVDYWYTSADESAAVEFMLYVQMFLKMYGDAYRYVEQTDLVEDGDVRVMSVLLPEIKGRRTRITAMSSSPTRMRSKGGDLGISELGFHKNAAELWKAAVPVTTHGGRIRVISSHNGDTSWFNQLLTQARKHINPERYGQPRATDVRGSVHKVTILDAVDQGLVEMLNAKHGLTQTREQFIDELRAKVGSELAWQEEYLCNPSSEAMSFLPLSLYRPCISPDAPMPTGDLARFLADVARNAEGCSSISAGCDVARVNDRFVIWVFGRVGSQRRTLGVFVAKGIDFAEMEQVLHAVMQSAGFRVRRMTMDATGLGMQLAERMVKKYRGRVEAVTMTAKVKEDMFTRLRAGMEERTVGLPDDPDCMSDFGTLRREVTAAGNTRYAADANEKGHADRATGCALALVADESAKATMRAVHTTGVL